MEATLSNSDELIDDLFPRPIKVLFVLPSLVRAGAETQVVNLVNGLDPACFEKHLFVFEHQLDQLDRVDRERLQFCHSPRQHRFDIAPAIRLARLIDEQYIDIVHCSLQIALFMSWLAIQLAKRKPRLVFSLHTTVNRNRRDELFDRLLYQWLMRSCDLIICVCKAQETYWQEKYPFLYRRTKVVYNGVDAEWFNPETVSALGTQLRARHGVPENAFLACCIAAFRPEKGHRYLLNAFKQLSDIHPHTYLMLAGDGPLREEMGSLVQQMGLTERVVFLGAIADVRSVLMASDVSIIASTAETFSMAMLESMAMGIPMVATDIGGTREAILDRTIGLLVEPGDATQLAEALSWMRVNNEQRLAMGIAARELVVQRFTGEMMLSETVSALSSVLHGRNVG